MKVLIAIVSCHKNLYLRECQRKTWVSEISKAIDFRFFIGIGESELTADEVKLDCPDDYTGLPAKVRAICQWAIDNEYDYLFKCDDDTYVRPDRLIQCGFEAHDYMGRLRPPSGAWKHDYALGGPGYWLSIRAMKAIAAAELTEDTIEDRWVGYVLHNKGIESHNENRFIVPQITGSDPTPRPFNKLITSCELHGTKMLDAHKLWISGLSKDYINDRNFGNVRR